MFSPRTGHAFAGRAALAACAALALAGALPAHADEGAVDPARPTCEAACNGNLSYPAGEGGVKAAGQVSMLVCFAPEGEVIEASPLDRSGHAELDEATRRFALGWRVPAVTEGVRPQRRCRHFGVQYTPPPSDAEPREHGKIAISWGGEFDDAVASHEPYRCDAKCEQASPPPVDRKGRKLAGRAVFEVCFRGDGTPEKVKLRESSGRDEVDEAARRHLQHVATDAVPPGTIVPRRCPWIEMRYSGD